jgi:hypothetical protein
MAMIPAKMIRGGSGMGEPVYHIIQRYETLRKRLEDLGCKFENHVNSWIITRGKAHVGNVSSLEVMEGILMALEAKEKIEPKDIKNPNCEPDPRLLHPSGMV